MPQVRIPMERPKVISTFAGCGGSILGYRAAGFEDLLAIEFEEDAVVTLKQNFPGLQVHDGDIRELTAETCMEMAGVKPRELDVLDGSPPCQGFSLAGRRKINDDRSQLYLDFVRLLEAIQPKAFVVENVVGMISGKMQWFFVQMMAALRGAGYLAKAQVMNSMWFGVPQRRRRLIVVGIREDIGIEPSHPKPAARPITFEEACGDLRGDTPEDRYPVPIVKWMAKQQPRKWTTEHELFVAIKGDPNGSYNLVWADWNRVCGTIVAMETNIAGVMHPDRRRYISLAEARRIGGFPDDFEFTDRDLGIQRIGNSVPPPLMRAIATHIKEALSGGEERQNGKGRARRAGQKRKAKAKAKAKGTAKDKAPA